MDNILGSVGLLVTVVILRFALLGVLPLDATRPAAAEGRLQAEVDVLLAVQTHNV